MLYFQDMRESCEAVVAMKKGPVHCAEILDKKSLASVNDNTGEGLTAVLIQTFAYTKEELQSNINEIMAILEPFHLYVPAVFTDDPKVYGKYWAIRSGIFPSVGGTRPLGTTVLIEDVAFHIEDLPDATVDLAQMLIDYGYDDEDVKDELRDYGKDTVRIPPDKNGRITIPDNLIRYAGFSDKVVVVGVGEYAELWSEERLVAYEAEREELKAKRRAKKDRERKARLAALDAESEG